MKFTAAKLPNGKIVEVLGHTTDNRIAICHDIYSDKAFELRRYLPADTKFVWVRTFNFKDE